MMCREPKPGEDLDEEGDEDREKVRVGLGPHHDAHREIHGTLITGWQPDLKEGDEMRSFAVSREPDMLKKDDTLEKMLPVMGQPGYFAILLLRPFNAKYRHGVTRGIGRRYTWQRGVVFRVGMAACTRLLHLTVSTLLTRCPAMLQKKSKKGKGKGKDAKIPPMRWISKKVRRHDHCWYLGCILPRVPAMTLWTGKAPRQGQAGWRPPLSERTESQQKVAKADTEQA